MRSCFGTPEVFTSDRPERWYIRYAVAATLVCSAILYNAVTGNAGMSLSLVITALLMAYEVALVLIVASTATLAALLLFPIIKALVMKPVMLLAAIVFWYFFMSPKKG